MINREIGYANESTYIKRVFQAVGAWLKQSLSRCDHSYASPVDGISLLFDFLLYDWLR